MSTQTTSGGIGLGTLLGVAFIILKLTGVINWSWWWVTCPLWAGVAIFIVVLIIMLVAAIIAGLIYLLAD